MNLMTCHNQEEEDKNPPPVFYLPRGLSFHKIYHTCYDQGDEEDGKKVPSVGTLGQLSFVTSNRVGGTSRGRREGCFVQKVGQTNPL